MSKNKEKEYMVTYKYRLYPTPAQEALLTALLSDCCTIYNLCVEFSKDIWNECGLTVTHRELRELAKEALPAEHKALYSQVAQDVSMRFGKARDGWFKARERCKKNTASAADRKHRAPGFRKASSYSSLTYPQSGFKILDKGAKHMPFGKGGRKRRWLRLSKIGDIVMVLHRPVIGNIKTCTIKRKANAWYVCFVCALTAEQYFEPQNNKRTAVGADIGIGSFAVFSDGTVIENPRLLKKEMKRLKKAQKCASKKTKGSKRRVAANNKIAKIHAKIDDKRRDFHSQIAAALVKRYGAMVWEDLSPGFMLSNHHLAQAASDIAVSQFFGILNWKCFRTHTPLVFVDPRNTSQLCCRCGTHVQKELSERRHECPQCGLHLSRDLNAAVNILSRGLSLLPSGYTALSQIQISGTAGTAGTGGSASKGHGRRTSAAQPTNGCGVSSEDEMSMLCSGCKATAEARASI